MDCISVNLTKKARQFIYGYTAYGTQECFSHHPLSSLHILAHIVTMKYITIFNIFLEYNHVWFTHLKESFFSIGLLCDYWKSFQPGNFSYILVSTYCWNHRYNIAQNYNICISIYVDLQHLMNKGLHDIIMACVLQLFGCFVFSFTELM